MYRIVKEYELIRSKESVEKTKYVKNMFGEISARYDLLNWIMTLGKHRKWREKAAVIVEIPSASLRTKKSMGSA